MLEVVIKSKHDDDFQIKIYKGADLVGSCYMQKSCGEFYWLIALQVTDEYRRQGAATLMLEVAKKLAYDTSIELDVRVDNEPAKNLYIKAGFVTIEENTWRNADRMEWSP